MEGPFYIYILFNKKTLLPFYGGSTKDPKGRYAWHKHHMKKRGIRIAFALAVYKIENDRESALLQESIVVKYLSDRYGDSVLNKAMKSKKYRPIIGNSTHKPSIKWVTLTEELRNKLFALPQWGEFSGISRLCDFSAERIRQVFIRKPHKIHPEIFKAIVAYRKIKCPVVAGR